MNLGAWTVVAALGGAAGWFLVFYLTTAPLRMSSALALTLSACFLALGLIARQFSGALAVGALALVVVSMVAGYWAAAIRVLGREDDRFVPACVRAVGDRGEGHVAVVYFTLDRGD